MIAYLFPGQGSQQKGMGGALFDEFPDLTAQAADILGFSIKELCLEDPRGQLGQTRFTQPALFIVNALSYLKKIEETGKKPDYVAGHSVGEYNALFAAGAFNFETGLKLVKKRGELMAGATGGGMAAVVGLSAEKVAKILEENGFESIDMANYNTPSQIVISGPGADIERAGPFFEAAGAMMYVILKVSGAFHSRYMLQSGNEFEKYVRQFNFSTLSIPVISNLTARPYKQSELIENMVRQLTNPVKWTESIRYLMGKGVTEMIEVGPGMVITGLVRSIQREAKPLEVTE